MLPLGRGEGHASAGAEPAPSQDRNEASPLQVVSVLTPVAEPRKPLLPQICPGCSRAHPPPHSPAQLAGGGNSLCLPSAAGPCPLLPPAGAMQVRDKCTPRCVGPTPQSPPPGRGPDPPTRGRPHTHARLRLARLTAPPPPRTCQTAPSALCNGGGGKDCSQPWGVRGLHRRRDPTAAASAPRTPPAPNCARYSSAVPRTPRAESGTAPSPLQLGASRTPPPPPLCNPCLVPPRHTTLPFTSLQTPPPVIARPPQLSAISVTA